MIPGIALLGVLAFRAFPRQRARSFALGGASGLLAALAFFTDFYVAWFSTLASGVAVLILLAGGRRRVITLVLAWLRRSWPVVVVGSAAFVVGLIPFVVTYLPTSHRLQKLSYSTVMLYAPRPRDLINVGTRNLLWTSVANRVVVYPRLSYSFVTYAVTPVLMLLAVVGAALALWITRRDSAPRTRILFGPPRCWQARPWYSPSFRSRPVSAACGPSSGTFQLPPSSDVRAGSVW